MKYFKLFEQFANEDPELAFYTQGINEGKMGDFFGQIRDLATKAAEKHYKDAAEHVNVTKLEKYPLKASEPSSVQRELETQSLKVDEGFVDSLRNLTKKGWTAGVYGSVSTGALALSSGLNYIEATFSKWYYQVIQGMAEADVMKVMTDIYGASAAESSIWFKIGMYAFFVFFTLATLSYITARIIKGSTKNIKESEQLNEAKIDYSLKDLMSDAPDKEYAKMCDFIASTIGEDPKNIAVITSEDDNFGDYEEKFRNSKFTPMNNPSAETSTFYSKDSNVVMSNDGSAVSYFVSAKDMI